MSGRKFIGCIGVLLSVLLLSRSLVYAGNPPDQGHTTISGTEVPADGTTWSTVTVTLEDSGGAPLNNDQVTFSSTDSTTSFAPSSGTSQTLDQNGTTQVQMKSTTVGAVNITVTDTSAGNAQVTGTVTFDQVTETPTPTPTPTPANSCSDSAPGSTPQLTSAVPSGAHSVILTWTDASDPVSYYLLSYGVSSGNYIYGNPNVGGQGTTTYTVGNLATGTRYYFAVMAWDGCASSSYSNEVSAVAGGEPTATPAPDDSSVTTDTVAPTDQIPTDMPLDTGAPTAVPTSAPASTSHSMVKDFVYGGAIFGVLLITGVVVWNIFLERKKQRPPQKPFRDSF